MTERSSNAMAFGGLLLVSLMAAFLALGPLGRPDLATIAPMAVQAIASSIDSTVDAAEDVDSDPEPQPEAAASSASLPESASIPDVPLLEQLPELERGCEVTSLAMLLQFAGIDVDKMTLADEIRKDPTPFEQDDDGTIHFGNPNDGFVGDIATSDEPGYGVYHGPVLELARQYVGDRAIDLTGSAFDDLLSFVSRGQPVWIITNMLYEPLDDDSFETWDTPDGPVTITYLEHSVVITGYTPDIVRVNDPLEGEIEVDRKAFADAWVQMGSQAIALQQDDKQPAV